MAPKLNSKLVFHQSCLKRRRLLLQMGLQQKNVPGSSLTLVSLENLTTVDVRQPDNRKADTLESIFQTQNHPT